jgi:hypothetical protein
MLMGHFKRDIDILPTHPTGVPCGTQHSWKLGNIHFICWDGMSRRAMDLDQLVSVESGGFKRLIKYIRIDEASKKNGVKRIY